MDSSTVVMVLMVAAFAVQVPVAGTDQLTRTARFTGGLLALAIGALFFFSGGRWGRMIGIAGLLAALAYAIPLLLRRSA